MGGFTFTCHGWLPIEFTVAGISTRQPLYFCDTVNKIYFSRRGCIDVGILSPNFPLPSHIPSSGVSSISSEDQQQSCDATSAMRSSHPITDTEPSSRPLPQRPAKIPYPPSPDNIPKLEKYLLDSFRESAFNCTHPFPHMPGPAAHIHLQEDAIPKARHTPIPVPFHLKSAVKAGLDNDVKRGIIAPVPMDTPTDWCSVMVVTAKKDGSPRRTVDFQYLNSQCKRETHHTASPFHLACQIPPHTRKTVLDAVDAIDFEIIKDEIWGQGPSSIKFIVTLTVLKCIFGANLEILTWISEFSRRQVQHGVDLCKVKFDLAGHNQSLSKTIGTLIKVFYTSGPNLVILAWTDDKLWHWRAQGPVLLTIFCPEFKFNGTFALL